MPRPRLARGLGARSLAFRDTHPTVPRLLTLAASVALLASIAGCGGDGGGGAEYALAPTLSCLTAAGLDATEESARANPLAGGKPDIDVDYGDYDVYVIFADDSDAAKATAASVNALSARFGGRRRTSAPTKGNVVMYWNGEKVSAERQDQIEACLTE